MTMRVSVSGADSAGTGPTQSSMAYATGGTTTPAAPPATTHAASPGNSARIWSGNHAERPPRTRGSGVTWTSTRSDTPSAAASAWSNTVPSVE